MYRIVLFSIIFNFNIVTLAAVISNLPPADTSFDPANHLKLYIKEIKSVAIDFQQTDTQGLSAIGKLLIDKPFKFRCNYYKPYPLLIIGNKNYLSVYDYDMDELSRVKASENIFKFLLMDNIEIEKHFKIENVLTENNIIKFVLYHYDSDRQTIVGFDKNNKQITMMEIIEGENIINIKFDATQQVASFDQDLFILKSPVIYGPPDRLDKSEIEKKYKLLS